MRIVSLLPSATEIICRLGLGPDLVGISHGCDFPDEITGLPVVTSSVIGKDISSRDIDQTVRDHLNGKTALYDLDLDLLASLEPEIIVTQALCDVCAVDVQTVEASLQHLSVTPQILNLEPFCFDDIFRIINDIGTACDIQPRTAQLLGGLEARVRAVRQATKREVSHRPSVAFLDWIDPLFQAGHWIPELIDFAGGTDCLNAAGKPSENLSFATLRAADPDVIVIACCGYDVARSVVDIPLLSANEGWRELTAVRAGNVWIADGNGLFSRPGPRLVESLELLGFILHADIHGAPDWCNENWLRRLPRTSDLAFGNAVC